MNIKFTSTPTRFLIFFFLFLELIISPVFLSTINAEHHHHQEDQQDSLKNKQSPNAVERAIGITIPETPWMLTIRSWLKFAWMNIRPPDSQVINKEASNSGELMKEAVSKSFETSKETAKKTAKVAGDAIHKTAEKVIKKTGSGTSGTDNKNQQEL